MTYVKSNESIFHGLSSEGLLILNSYSEDIHLKPGDVLAKEGDKANQFYYILSGSVGVFKQTVEGVQHRITVLGRHAVLGEMALIDDKPRSATLIAQEPTTLRAFTIEEVKKHSDIYSHLLANIGINLSERLRYTNDVTLISMEKALFEEAQRISLATFTELILTTLSLFTLFVGVIQWLHSVYIHTNIVSTILLYLFIIPLFYYIKKSGLPKHFFGLTIENWRHDTVRAILYSIPIMIIIMIVKYSVISYSGLFHDRHLFEPVAKFTVNNIVSWNAYIISMIAYLSTCLPQEIIVRGCLQGSLYTFTAGSEAKRKMSAIFISNLIFSAFHVHNSIIFAFSVFFTGLFWGWLYSRQKSIIGVTVSHMLIGLWAGFILGIPELFLDNTNQSS